MSQAELWLEVTCPDTQAAARHLKRHAVVRCDDIEALPEEFGGFWIKSPAGIVHLVSNG